MCIAVNSWAADTLTIHTQLTNCKLPFIAGKQCQDIVRILNVRLFCKLEEFLEPLSSSITPLLQVSFPSLLLPHITWYTSSKYSFHYIGIYTERQCLCLLSLIHHYPLCKSFTNERMCWCVQFWMALSLDGCSSMTSLPVSDKLQDGASMNMLRQWICCILKDTNLNISVNLRSIIVIKVSWERWHWALKHIFLNFEGGVTL